MRKVMIFALFFLTGLVVFPQARQNQRESGFRNYEKKMGCREKLVVKSLVKGSVSEVLVKTGDRVQTGQILIRLDCSELEKKKNRLGESLKKWESILSEQQQEASRDRENEKRTEDKIGELQDEIRETDRQLARKQIRSLIDGVVVDIIAEGTLVTEDMAVATIGKDRVLEIVLKAGEDYRPGEFHGVREGQEIPLTFDGMDGAILGEVRKEDSSLVIQIPNDKQILVPGGTARFRLKIEPRPAVQDRVKNLEARVPVPSDNGKSTKFDFEVSAGISYSDPGDFFLQASGIDAQVEQYIDNYGLEYTVTGEFGKKRLYFPLGGTVNYRLSDKFYIKGGLEFGYSDRSNQKTYTLDWGSFSEEIRYQLSSTVTYFLPYVGAETRFGEWGVYGNLCLNFLSLSNVKNTRISDPGQWVEANDDVSASGTGFGIILGGKTHFRIGKKMNLLVKLEFCYLKIGKLSGTRDSSVTRSNGDSSSESVDGILYSFEINPYDLGWFSSWELYDSAPSGALYRDVGQLSYNFSCIRLQVGFVF